MVKKIIVIIIFLLNFAAASAADNVLEFFDHQNSGMTLDVSIVSPEILTFVEEKQTCHNPQEGYFDRIIWFSGLRPGETYVIVEITEPNKDDRTLLYTAEIDDELNVTISRDTELTDMYFFREIDDVQYRYEIDSSDNGLILRVNDTDQISITDETVETIIEITDKYNIQDWNGFCRKDDPSDGKKDESFVFEAGLSNGTIISSNGRNNFPNNYFEAVNELETLLRNISGSVHD
ncbi:MAG: hypothetical protein IJI14_08880 [Anaerolineaceae bacterium]|nr:hypothetical protein [Anaerolineaceae bacterium]